jgi:hypothetical protein
LSFTPPLFLLPFSLIPKLDVVSFTIHE